MYNLTLRVYVPGFGARIDPEHNLTFEGELVLKFGVNRTCRRIELNALKLRFPQEDVASAYALRREDREGDADAEDEAETPKVTAVQVDEAREKVFFELDKQMREGANYSLRVSCAIQGVRTNFRTFRTPSIARGRI